MRGYLALTFEKEEEKLFLNYTLWLMTGIPSEVCSHIIMHFSVKITGLLLELVLTV